MKNLKLPNLLLLGAQKSASTYLGAWLGNHSDVYIKSKEESSFEDPEYVDFDISRLAQKIDKKYYGIRRPDYFGNVTYQERLHKWLPDAHIIIVLRNPVDRAFSAYFHYMKYGITPIKKADYLYKILEGKHNKKYRAYDNILLYGEYYKLYSTLITYFKKEKILILKQEQLNDDKTFLKIAEFLGIPSVIPKRPTSIPQQSIYNLERLRIKSFYLPFKNRYDEYYSKSYSRKITDLNIIESVIVKVGTLVERKLYKDSKDKLVLSDDLRNALLEYYRKDMIEFNNLGIIDISDWLN